MTDYQQNYSTFLVPFGFCFNLGVILLMYCNIVYNNIQGRTCCNSSVTKLPPHGEFFLRFSYNRPVAAEFERQQFKFKTPFEV